MLSEILAVLVINAVYLIVVGIIAKLDLFNLGGFEETMIGAEVAFILFVLFNLLIH